MTFRIIFIYYPFCVNKTSWIYPLDFCHLNHKTRKRVKWNKNIFINPSVNPIQSRQMLILIKFSLIKNKLGKYETMFIKMFSLWMFIILQYPNIHWCYFSLHHTKKVETMEVPQNRRFYGKMECLQNQGTLSARWAFPLAAWNFYFQNCSSPFLLRLIPPL